jgi:6-phosphogluconolactonase
MTAAEEEHVAEKLNTIARRAGIMVLLAAAFCITPAAHCGGVRRRYELVFAGTMTKGVSQGIYAYRFDPRSGETRFLGLAAATPNPSFLAVSRDQRFLYAVNELPGRGEAGGTVSAFSIMGDSGRLESLNKVSSGGEGPCDLALGRAGRVLLVTNCNSGTVALLPVRADGRLGRATAVVQHEGSSINPVRQNGPHAHGVAIAPDDRFAAVADLGMDKVLLHPLDVRSETLGVAVEEASVTPGGGVRHLAFLPDGKFLYSIDELDSELTVFAYAKGSLRKVQTISALPLGVPPSRGGSEVIPDSSGRFLYVSVRGEQNQIAVFVIDRNTGHLAPLQFISTEGTMPRHLALDLSETWIAAANQNSHSIVWLRRDPATGKLASAHRLSIEVDSPTCIVFVRPR